MIADFLLERSIFNVAFDNQNVRLFLRLKNEIQTIHYCGCNENLYVLLHKPAKI